MILVPALTDIEKTARSDAERRVARLLQEMVSTSESVAFYSVGLRSHPYKQQAEADFVILWRGVVLVIEVKGGGVRRHDGVWYTIDRFGDWNKLDSSPMEQARSAGYALRDILKEQGLGWYPYEALVITPDIDAPPTSVDWKPTHWLSRTNMSVSDLASSFDAIAESARTPPPRTKKARQVELRDQLFGEFTRMPVVDAQRGAVVEEQNRATAGQARVLSALARNERVLVNGGAGTGKSLVLVEAAKQEAERGRSVLVTYKSASLADYFAPHLRDLPVDAIPFDELLPDAQYDVVLVDEAQDLMNADAMDRLDGIIAGGRTRGRWRMFLDHNNQAHIDGYYDQAIAELVADEAIEVDLLLNVRNTKAIVHVVKEYLSADVGDPGVVHGERVTWHTAESVATTSEGVSIANQLVRDGARRRDVWVIDPRADVGCRIDDGIEVVSPRYAKGLEAEYVVVCGLPSQLDAAGTAAFYVAVTRARVALHILLSKQDKQRLKEFMRLKAGTS